MKFNFLNKIFAAKNNDNHQVITIFGIKLKFKRNCTEKNIKEAICSLENSLKSDLKNTQIQLESKIQNIELSFCDSKSILENIQKRLDDIYYNQQVLVQVPFVHKYMAQFRRCYENRDVVCIAPGPTIKYYKPIENAIHVGLNGVFRSFKNLDYLFLTDYFINDSALNEEIDKFSPQSCKKFYMLLPQRRLQVLNKDFHFAERIPQSNFIKANAYPALLEDIFQGKFAVDLEVEPFGDWGGSVFSALQFIMFTHPKRVFLVGNDCSQGRSYEKYDENSEPPNYSDKIDWLKQFKAWADKIYPDVEIISINPVGLKGVFKDEYTQEYLESIKENENKN